MSTQLYNDISSNNYKNSILGVFDRKILTKSGGDLFKLIIFVCEGSSLSLLLAALASKFINGLLALKFLSELASKSIKSSVSISNYVTAWAAANPGSAPCQEPGAELCAAVEDDCETTKSLSLSGSELKYRFESKLL